MKASNSGVNPFDCIKHMQIHDILQGKGLKIVCLMIKSGSIENLLGVVAKCAIHDFVDEVK